LFGCLAKADHTHFVITAPDEDETAQPQPAPPDRGLPNFAIVFAIVDVIERGVEVEGENFGKVYPMLREVAGPLRLVPGDHGVNVARARVMVNIFM
jgi:hypothetical protein